MEKVMMKLDGLTCPSCLTKIQKSVETIDGTDDVKVLFNAGKVKFTLDLAKASPDDVEANIEKMGYTVQGIKVKELSDD